jgi:teichuronic acid biosynthesis glycosyltransferase TuaG
MIIVDDCSKDNTYQVACNFAAQDCRIKILRNAKNSGAAITRNTALAAATGDYIAFLDSDDLWLPKKLEKQIAFMENKQYALTYTPYQKFDTKTGKKGKIIRVPEKMTARRIYGDTSIGCLTVIVNRNIVGDFRMPLISHTEDNCTWQEILSRGYVAYRLNEVLSLYREGYASLTNSKKKAARLQWQTYREYYKFSVPESIFYFSCYTLNAVKKHFL